MDDNELQFLRTRLKIGEYDGSDIMRAWLAIDELRELRAWRDKAFQAHPNLDLDIEALGPCPASHLCDCQEAGQPCARVLGPNVRANRETTR
jgi:hypothetical protein